MINEGGGEVRCAEVNVREDRALLPDIPYEDTATCRLNECSCPVPVLKMHIVHNAILRKYRTRPSTLGRSILVLVAHHDADRTGTAEVIMTSLNTFRSFLHVVHGHQICSAIALYCLPLSLTSDEPAFVHGTTNRA